MALAAGAREGLELEDHGGEVVAKAPRALLRVEARLEARVLGGDADRAAAGMAVVAEAGLGPESVVVLHVVGPVAPEGDEGGGPDRHRVRSERERLRGVRAVADPARHDELHLAVHVQLLQRLDRLADGGEGRNARVLDEDVLGRGGAALHPVHDHRVRPRLDREGDVEPDPRGPDLDVDRKLPVGDLAQLLDLDLEVVGAGPVRVAAGAPLVDAHREVPHPRDALGDLLPEEHPPAPRLRALPHHHLDGVARPQVVGVEAVARRQHLVDEELRRLALLGGHPAVPGGGAGPHRGRRPADGALRVRAERAEAHPRDGDRDRELERAAGEAGADGDRGLALLAVALERVAGHRGAEQEQVVEGGERALRAEPANVVHPLVRRPVDLRDDRRGKRGGRAQPAAVGRSAAHGRAPRTTRRRDGGGPTLRFPEGSGPGGRGPAGSCRATLALMPPPLRPAPGPASKPDLGGWPIPLLGAPASRRHFRSRALHPFAGGTPAHPGAFLATRPRIPRGGGRRLRTAPNPGERAVPVR